MECPRDVWSDCKYYRFPYQITTNKGVVSQLIPWVYVPERHFFTNKPTLKRLKCPEGAIWLPLCLADTKVKVNLMLNFTVKDSTAHHCATIISPRQFGLYNDRRVLPKELWVCRRYLGIFYAWFV